MNSMISVHDADDLKKLCDTLGAKQGKGGSLFGVPVYTDSNLPKGFVALITDCPQCMAGSKPGVCDRCLGLRQTVRLVKLA